MSLNLSNNEKRDVIKFLEAGEPLPEKYRFLLFKDDREVELVWNGKTEEVTNVVLPFQTIEQIDEPREGKEFGDGGTLFDMSGKQITGWTNKLIWGDNKLILSSLKNGPLRKEIEAQGGLKLIYIDPPFDVGADFSMDIKIGDGEDEESFTKKPSVIEEIAFRDTWGNGVDSFIAMIYERLKLMHDLLAEDGSIYVHCDWRLNSCMRLILDEIFGKDNFTNEIIWKYFGPNSSKKNYPKKHDTILFYSKTDSKIFNFDACLVDYDEKAIARYDKTDKDGKKYKIYFDKDGKEIRAYLKEGTPTEIFEIPFIQGIETQKTDYPTQKPEKLLERIIKASSNDGDLIADFFCGSGTTLAVAEKLNRKWIGSDLGKFGIHSTRKRMIGIQRELKKAGKDFRAFEILNVGKYERENFLNINEDLRAEQKAKQAERKEKEFVKLILSAYKAEAVESFINIVGKKRDRLIAVGPINTPVSSELIRQIVSECKEKNITKIDVLGFDYEMGLDFSQYKDQNIDILFKKIPREVFDKKAVEKGQVKFYDVAFLEVEAIISGKGNSKELSIKLTDFSVFYNQDNDGEIEEALKPGSSKIVVKNGQVIKINKDKQTENVSEEILTKKWSDWVDYWAIDYDFTDRKEIIKVIKDGTEKEVWTGSYIFDNEWQEFRTKKKRSLELVSAPKELPKGTYKVAVKIVDIFGNDTTRVIDVKI
ncbi:MAG: site-specific DNA-methyltransferase [Candidatus Paceibacterota bacterium]|jgi:DNA modification methylase